jgi:phosphomannomutase
LATIFEDGNHGLARKYYQEAVNQGYPKAEHDLGVMLRHGKGGDKDTAMALKLFLSALNKRHKQSMDYINELENLTDSMIAEMDIMKTLFFLDREIKEFKINKNKAILLNSRKFYKKHKRQEKN